MKWIWIGASWLLLSLLAMAFFYAMVTIRDMEKISFEKEGEMFCDACDEDIKTGTLVKRGDNYLTLCGECYGRKYADFRF